MFLGWFDPSTHKSATQKVLDGITRFKEKEGIWPELVLVNQRDSCEVDGVQVRVVSYVQPNHFWIGIGALPVEYIQ